MTMDRCKANCGELKRHVTADYSDECDAVGVFTVVDSVRVNTPTDRFAVLFGNSAAGKELLVCGRAAWCSQGPPFLCFFETMRREDVLLSIRWRWSPAESLATGNVLEVL